MYTGSLQSVQKRGNTDITVSVIIITVPRMFGTLLISIRPTSHTKILVTGSNVYFPCDGFRIQFNTDFGIGISSTTFSTYKVYQCDYSILLKIPTKYILRQYFQTLTVLPTVWRGPTVISKRPPPISLKEILWRT